MRVVSRLSYSCAKKLSLMLNEGHKKRSVYYFSLQVIFGSLVKNIVLFTIALIAGTLIPTLIVAIAFSSLRMLAGGYHMDAYGKCLAVTISMFIGCSIIAQYTFSLWNTTALFILIFFMVIIGMYVIIRYAPKDTPHKPITSLSEMRKFKQLSVGYFLLIVSTASLLAVFKFNLVVISLCLGVLLELFMVTPTGYKFFGVVNRVLSKKK